MVSKAFTSPLVLLMVVVAMAGASPFAAQAQYVAHASVGVRATSPDGHDSRSRPSLGVLVPAQPEQAGSGKTTYVVGGMLVGAITGALLASAFHSDFCGAPSPGVTCSSTSVGEGLVIGAAVGALVGWVVWSATRPAR
jgi:hypothetical protein